MAPAPRAAAPAPRTPAQNRAIYGLRSRFVAAGVDADDADTILRAACTAVAGHEHTSKLTTGQAQRLIDRLERELATYTPAPAKPSPAPHKPWGERGPGQRIDQPITPFQNTVIQGLFNLCAATGAGFDTFQKRRAFAQRQCKRDWPETLADADAMIEPLAAIALRKVDVDDIARRVAAMVGHKALDPWKRDFVADLHGKFTSGSGRKRLLTPYRLAKIIECEAWIAERAGAR